MAPARVTAATAARVGATGAPGARTAQGTARVRSHRRDQRHRRHRPPPHRPPPCRRPRSRPPRPPRAPRRRPRRLGATPTGGRCSTVDDAVSAAPARRILRPAVAFATVAAVLILLFAVPLWTIVL